MGKEFKKVLIKKVYFLEFIRMVKKKRENYGGDKKLDQSFNTMENFKITNFMVMER